MKRMILIIASMFVALTFSTLAMAWSVVKTESSGSDLNHYVRCDSGRIISVIENPSINKYFVGGTMYDNMYDPLFGGG